MHKTPNSVKCSQMVDTTWNYFLWKNYHILLFYNFSITFWVFSFSMYFCSHCIWNLSFLGQHKFENNLLASVEFVKGNKKERKNSRLYFSQFWHYIRMIIKSKMHNCQIFRFFLSQKTFVLNSKIFWIKCVLFLRDIYWISVIMYNF